VSDPVSHWPVAEPASLGLSEQQLLKIHADINDGQYGWIDSFLVIRNGRIAFERYYEHDYGEIYGEESRTPGPLVVQNFSGPYNYFNAFWHPYYKSSDLHSMQSVTKSIVSAVIGIAVGRGDFPDIDTPVLSFFDATQLLNIDDTKRAMTIRDLLTMSAGLEWDEGVPYSDPTNTFTIMARSPDWVQYTLDQPMASQPGTEFNYNSGASLILSQIFLQATGIDIEVYAEEHLFQPLGIERYEWKRTPTGIADTQEGLFLSARDLAKIAQLFLQNGQWNNREVVPQRLGNRFIEALPFPSIMTLARDMATNGGLWPMIMKVATMWPT
jgi:CubicO group peptidase (beta-lactamase class C family)